MLDSYDCEGILGDGGGNNFDIVFSYLVCVGGVFIEEDEVVVECFWLELNFFFKLVFLCLFMWDVFICGFM